MRISGGVACESPIGWLVRNSGGVACENPVGVACEIVWWEWLVKVSSGSGMVIQLIHLMYSVHHHISNPLHTNYFQKFSM